MGTTAAAAPAPAVSVAQQPQQQQLGGAAAAEHTPPRLDLCISIRPSYAYGPSRRRADLQQQACCDDGLVAASNSGWQSTAAVLSGCGRQAAEAVLAARQSLEHVLQPAQQHGDAQEQTLTPAGLEAAFEQCHAQLLQQQGLDVQHSGASCLLLALDQQQDRLLVASAGLCRAVLARSSAHGRLTVLELSPRLALGHDAAETARLDAAGSSVCYVGCSSSSQQDDPPGQQPDEAVPAAEDGPFAAAAAAQIPQAAAATNSSSTARRLALPPCSPVLMGPDGRILTGVGASRLLGYAAANATGVLPQPVVTSWRLTQQEAFVVLGSPGLWAAMNPAEVVDYVAAVLASGAAAAGQAGTAPGAAPKQQQQQPGALASDAAALLSDLLTLEAQERLKLQLSDAQPFAGAVAAATAGVGGAAGAQSGLVPDVTAIVLLLPGAAPLLRPASDPALLQEQLGLLSRGCRSLAEAQALQATWTSKQPACNSGSLCSTSGGNASMSSSTSSSTGTFSLGSRQGSSYSCQSFPGLSPPAPALSCLLPVLTVAGHCWPSSLWPGSRAAVRVPSSAALPSRNASYASSSRVAAASASPPVGSGSAGSSLVASFDEAAAAAGVLRRSLSGGGGGGPSVAPAAGAHPRQLVGFTLSQRLSCELDLTRSGSISSMLAQQAAAADAAAEAAELLPGAASSSAASAAPQGAAALAGTLSSSAEEQAVIVHKVRLAGPCELESLLYGTPTTAHPDTTVARILRPRAHTGRGGVRGSSSSGSLGHAYSWAAPGALPGAAGSSCYPGSLRQQRASMDGAGGWASGGHAARHHPAPHRSASVSIAMLARQVSSSGPPAVSLGSSGGSSAAAANASCQQLASSLKSTCAAEARLAPPLALRQQQQHFSEGQELSERGLGARARRASAAAYTAVAAKAASAGAGGRVGKARSYQALSALHCAISACSADKSGGLPGASPNTTAMASQQQRGASSAEDAAMLLVAGYQRTSSGGLAAALQPGLHFRPAFAAPAGPAAAQAPAAAPGAWNAPAIVRRTSSGWLLSASAEASMQQDQQQDQQQEAAVQQLSGSYKAAVAALAAAGSLERDSSLADSLGGGTASSLDADLPEGKVHGGLVRSRTSSLQAMLSGLSDGTQPPPAAAAAAEDEPGELGSDEEPACGDDEATHAWRQQHQEQPGLPRAASADWGSCDSKLRAGAALAGRGSDGGDPCLRGGRGKLARLKASASTPALCSLAATASSSGAVPAAKPGDGTHTKPPRRQTEARKGWGSLPAAAAAHQPTLSDTLAIQDVAAAAPHEAADAAECQQRGSRRESLFAAAVEPARAEPLLRVCSVSLSPGASLELQPSESSQTSQGGADGAVHGGELGEQALEGQMHGGRRSKSMSHGSLVLSPSLPSDDDTLASTCPSPGSMQQQPHRHHSHLPVRSASGTLVRSSNSYGSSISCGSSSVGGGVRGTWGSLSSIGSPLLPPHPASGAAEGAPGAAAGPGDHPALSPFGAASMQHELPAGWGSSLAAGSSTATSGADAERRTSIEVLRSPSGSFTRVRLAASAPAAAADEQITLAGVEHSSPADGAAAVAAGSASAWSPAVNRGWSSPGRQVKSFGSTGPGSGSGSSKPWSPSTAWGSSGAAPSGQQQLSATGSGGSSAGVRSMMLGGAASAGGARAAWHSSSTLLAAGAPGRTYVVTNGAPAARSSSGGGDSAADASVAAAAALLGSSAGAAARPPGRNRSGPLPCLEESPAHTPGTSPEVAFSFMSALEGTLSSHAEQPAAAAGASGGSSCPPDQAGAATQQPRQPGERAAAGGRGGAGARRGSSAGGDSASDATLSDVSCEALTLGSDSFEFSQHPGHDGWSHDSPLLGQVLLPE